MDVRSVLRKVPVGGPDTSNAQRLAVARKAEEMLRKAKLKAASTRWQVFGCLFLCCWKSLPTDSSMRKGLC
eukprot:scaffold8047_cov417-Prasinococcus_capsulatus_cf.AAC.7